MSATSLHAVGGHHSTGSFRDLKEILAAEADQEDSDSVQYEIKERCHLLCSKFLGGAWRSLCPDEISLIRIKKKQTKEQKRNKKSDKISLNTFNALKKLLF